jgi:hypothetical protein
MSNAQMATVYDAETESIGALGRALMALVTGKRPKAEVVYRAGITKTCSKGGRIT